MVALVLNITEGDKILQCQGRFCHGGLGGTRKEILEIVVCRVILQMAHSPQAKSSSSQSPDPPEDNGFHFFSKPNGNDIMSLCRLTFF